MRPHVNIVCVKYGNKYNSEYVNRLLKMVRRNCSLPFFFYCMTDNNEGLDSDIKVIDLDMSLDLESYWWKICLFNLDLEGPILYFDLDIVIQNNFDHVIDQIKDDKILTINVRHYGVWYPFDGSYNNILTIPEAKINSSVMGFYNHHSDIYYNFLNDVDSNIIVYYGLDRFLSEKYFKKFNWLDFSKDYYFRNKGTDAYDLRYIDSDGLILDPHKTFCIVSQAEPNVYERMKKYFL